MLILRAKIALTAVICMILFRFSLIMDHDYFETSDFIVRFYSFMFKENFIKENRNVKRSVKNSNIHGRKLSLIFFATNDARERPQDQTTFLNSVIRAQTQFLVPLILLTPSPCVSKELIFPQLTAS